ncbi:MAG: hypothetical protein V4572_10455 [Bacteroidota bacterium]
MKNLLPLLLSTLFFALSANSQNKNYATLKIKIANIKVDSLVIVSYKNPYFRKVIKADAEGMLKDTLNVKSDKYYISNSKLFPNGIYLNNGYDLKISVDNLQPSKTLQFSGKGANENEFVSSFAKHEENFDYESLLQLNETDFNKQIELIRLNLFTTLDKKKYGSDFVVYQTQYLDYFIKLKTETYRTIVDVREQD